MLGTNLGRLRITGIMEGVSFLILLGVAMPLKYIAHMPLATKVFGMAHGVLFVLYVLLVFIVKTEKKWDLQKTFFALIASLLPFGTFYADMKLFRKS